MKIRRYLYRIITDQNFSFTANLIKFFLFFISFLYFLFIKLILFLYDIRLLRKKTFNNVLIVSIGNITWGGTGKTPLVGSIARYFKEKGKNVVILSRGYTMRKNPEAISDETFMLSQKLTNIPIIVSPSRRKGIIEAKEKYGADIVLLDDGFQQWGIKKDLEIVVIDGINPFGNGWLIPRGILREPISSLKRADIFIINKVDMVEDKSKLKNLDDRLKKINPRAQIFNAIYLPQYLQSLTDGKKKDFGIIKDKDVCAFCGIASPQYFKFIVEKVGGSVKLFFEFLDHYFYEEKDLLNIFSSCLRQGIDILITTEKDAVRLLPFLDIIRKNFNKLSLFSLVIEPRILESDIFYARLFNIHNS